MNIHEAVLEAERIIYEQAEPPGYVCIAGVELYRCGCHLCVDDPSGGPIVFSHAPQEMRERVLRALGLLDHDRSEIDRGGGKIDE